MREQSILTKVKPTWCQRCYNFQILTGLKNFLEKQKNPKENYALVTGIGCHAKMFDYMNLNGINTLHGRVLPTCTGIKIAKPNLKIIGISGDGDAYAEGMEHLIHTAKNNPNFTYLIHNNQVFALTVGQPTPTTEKGFIDKTTPKGVKIQPLNPIRLMLAAGATFVARVFADVNQVEWILEKAEKHKGFSFIEILQPCIIFHSNKHYKEKTYLLDDKNHNKTDFKKAMEKAEEFDYNKANKIPLGIFYQKQKETFEECI